MGTGYTRNDTANNIADGNVINASDLDGEFDAIQAAFNASTGHSHDGTTGEGPQIGTGGIADNAVTLGTKTSGNYVATGAVSGVGLSGSASAEGATFTVTSNATDANTASTIVARDASGNFSAGNVTVGNLITAGNVDGRDVSVDGAKLDGIENGATADQTKSDIDALGINAATLDSLDSTQFLRSDAADTKTSGDLSFSDNVKAIFGAGSDLQIYHTGATSLITDTGTGNLSIGGSSEVNIVNSANDEFKARFITDGAVMLYHNNALKLATTSGGIDVTGTVTADGIIMSDNEVIKLGSSADLWIYHNGTHSIISDEGTGSLLLQGASQIVMQHPSTGEDYIVANANGAVTLYYDNAAKLATTSSGIDVTGTVTANDLTLEGNSAGGFVENTLIADYHTGQAQNNSEIQFTTGAYQNSGEIKIRTAFGATMYDRIRVGQLGDISFYADDGTTQGFYWDASTQRLGLGTTAPAKLLEIAAANTGASENNVLRLTDLDTAVVLDQPAGSIEWYTSDGDAVTSKIGAVYAGTGAGSSLVFSTAPTAATGISERLRIDEDGNVGIGSASPSTNLEINGGTNNNIVRIVSTDANANIEFADNTTTSGLQIGANGDNMKFGISGAEAMRIDSSGNLLVGKTSASVANDGIQLEASGTLGVTRTNDDVAIFNRRSSDGY